MPTLEELLNAKEGENYEFKEAKNSFEFDDLARYSCALSNEGGGCVVFGITDKRPRKVVGSKAFDQPERTRRSLIDKLHINVDFEELSDAEQRRVLVFKIPSRPVGIAVQYEKDGIAWWRVGDSLVRMPDDVRRRIYAEGGHDFSGDICPGATIDDLDMHAVEVFREMWLMKSRNANLRTLSAMQMLKDCEAMTDDGVTYAALVLFGSRKALSRYLPCAEIIYEYRQREVAGPADAREEFRDAFFNVHDRLWELVNVRNTKHHYQEGFFVWDIDRFNERSTREAVLNAVSRRNYQMPGSIFVIQYLDRLVVSSPGGFLPGVTPDNCHNKQAARNRRIAEILGKCGLVERSGQGMDFIYASGVREGKGLPDWTGTDDYEVRMTLNGMVLDDNLLLAMKKISDQTLESFSTQDFRAIDAILRDQPLPKALHANARKLLELGIIERIGRNKYVPSRKYYTAKGESGVHTRKTGLDKDTNKALLLKHIQKQGEAGGRMLEFMQVLPMLSRTQIQRLLFELRNEGKIINRGEKRLTAWFMQS